MIHGVRHSFYEIVVIIFSRHPVVVAWKANISSFIFHVLAVGSFSHLITFRVLRSFRYVYSLRFPTLHSASLYFTNLSTAQHKWFIHYTLQITIHISFRCTATFYPPTYAKLCNSCKLCTLQSSKKNSSFASFYCHPLFRSIQSPPMLLIHVFLTEYLVSMREFISIINIKNAHNTIIVHSMKNISSYISMFLRTV